MTSRRRKVEVPTTASVLDELYQGYQPAPAPAPADAAEAGRGAGADAGGSAGSSRARTPARTPAPAPERARGRPGARTSAPAGSRTRQRAPARTGTRAGAHADAPATEPAGVDALAPAPAPPAGWPYEQRRTWELRARAYAAALTRARERGVELATASAEATQAGATPADLAAALRDIGLGAGDMPPDVARAAGFTGEGAAAR